MYSAAVMDFVINALQGCSHSIRYSTKTLSIAVITSTE